MKIVIIVNLFLFQAPCQQRRCGAQWTESVSETLSWPSLVFDNNDCIDNAHVVIIGPKSHGVLLFRCLLTVIRCKSWSHLRLKGLCRFL